MSGKCQGILFWWLGGNPGNVCCWTRKTLVTVLDDINAKMDNTSYT